MKYFLILILVLFPFRLFAADYSDDLQLLINSMKQWSKSDTVVDAVKEQNERHVDLSLSDRKILDTKWRGERRKNKIPLTKKVLESEFSDYLRKIQKEGDGVYTEIIVVDNKGMNVGQSVISESYWQGKSEFWKKTFASRSYATYISDLSFNDNTGLFQIEVAFMLIVGEEQLGVVYAGVDVEKLEEWKKRQE